MRAHTSINNVGNIDLKRLLNDEVMRINFVCGLVEDLGLTVSDIADDMTKYNTEELNDINVFIQKNYDRVDAYLLDHVVARTDKLPIGILIKLLIFCLFEENESEWAHELADDVLLCIIRSSVGKTDADIICKLFYDLDRWYA